MSRIFDNIDQRLVPALHNSLQNVYHADFCVGYFILRCQHELAKWVFVAYAAPGSKTEAFRREVLAWSKSVYTFAGNEALIEIGAQVFTSISEWA